MKKTSKTHPLRIDGVSVPGTSGVIGMTLCPGKVQRSAISGDWERDLAADLRMIRDWGASILVTLMEPAELSAFKVGNLPREMPSGVEHFLLPITDGGIPDAEWERAWAPAGTRIRAALGSGAKVVVHCRGGLGRTGTVAARLLVEFGMDPEEAIAAVRKARPGAIENRMQEDHVRRRKPVEPSPARPCHRIAPDRASRFRGCLLGGAVGDALGARWSSWTCAPSGGDSAPGGIRDLAPAYGRVGAITDDTQMTLFTAEGVLRAHVRGALRGLVNLPGIIGHAYQRWLATQGVQGRAYGIGKDGVALQPRSPVLGPGAGQHLLVGAGGPGRGRRCGARGERVQGVRRGHAGGPVGAACRRPGAGPGTGVRLGLRGRCPDPWPSERPAARGRPGDDHP